MSLQVAILGIDGSGKSSVAASLPAVLAAETGLLIGSAGDTFRVAGPDEDRLGPGFHPEGLPFSARLSMRVRRMAKRVVDRRSLYPGFKLAQMMFQDHAARRIARKYGTAAMMSDGNTLLSATGRAANYRRPASEGGSAAGRSPDARDLEFVFSFLLEGAPIPAASRSRLPDLDRGRFLYRLSRLLGLDAVWLPDMVLFLDLPPELAASRIAARGSKVDRHENPADLAQARGMYLETLHAYQRYRPGGIVRCIPVGDRSPGEVLRAAVETLRPVLASDRILMRSSTAPLGTSEEELSGGAVWRKVLSRRYLFGYLLPNWFRHGWREPTFLLSNLGRLFRKEGYSAGVMRAIYDRDRMRHGLWDRVFLEYPLHRAVYDRLQILVRRIETLVEKKLSEKGVVRIFTAPSGFSYDLFRPLEAVLSRSPEAARRLRVVAADLDPHGVLGAELTARAIPLGISFAFHRGDIATREIRALGERDAPYDLALFVGLSSWMPKPEAARHLQWLRSLMGDDGILVSDCFTPDAYSLSGRYMGYRASYYSPAVYRMLLDYCGFDGLAADVESGRDAINHVVVAPARRARAEPERVAPVESESFP